MSYAKLSYHGALFAFLPVPTHTIRGRANFVFPRCRLSNILAFRARSRSEALYVQKLGSSPDRVGKVKKAYSTVG